MPFAITSGLTKNEDTRITRLRRAEEGAFDDLVNQLHGALIRMAMSFVVGRDVAEEVVQDTWIAVIEGLNRFQGRSSLRTWIFGILIHKAKDRGVREKRHMAFSDFKSFDDEGAVDPSQFPRSGEWVFPSQPWDRMTPEKLLASQQAVHAMWQAIDALSANLKEVLILRDVEGVEVKEVCRLLKITETNMYVRLHRARKQVRMMVNVYLESGKAVV